MPLYEYLCHSCGKKFEVLQKFSDEPLKTHPECGGDVEKVISAPAFHLKGTGWYATDYAKSNGGKSATDKQDKKDDKKEEKKSETKTESTSDSKPAASTESKSSPST